jgi:hypothetical protein
MAVMGNGFFDARPHVVGQIGMTDNLDPLIVSQYGLLRLVEELMRSNRPCAPPRHAPALHVSIGKTASP